MALGFHSHDDFSSNKNSRNFDFSGTNSLFVKIDSGLKVHWITQVKDSGYFEISRRGKTPFAKGFTESSRVHSVELDAKIKQDLILKFGGEKDGMHEVVLKKPETDLKTVYKNVNSIYVVGDVHGRYPQLITLLQKSKVIDMDLNWIAGEAHLVFLGDLFDRGSQVTKVLWFIYRLEDQAKSAGGKVHLVLGNHEIMTMTKDLRYLNVKEKNIAIGHKVTYDQMFHPQNSLLGLWLSGKPSVLKIDQFIFAHGGIVDLGTFTLNSFNEAVSYYMKDPMYLELTQEFPDSTKYDVERWYRMRDFFFYENGPYWYRGYVLQDTLDVQLNAMLKKYKSKVHIVAHTTRKTITRKYDGKLLTTDLDDAATELLFIKRNRRSTETFKIDSEGVVSPLE
ncbi:metallophosphoesterase [Lutimonas saemankumensis]|uniref:metallophosphoesterase n=1 Tax=Lutimonas saemankumensis TaxID=483016 RepID=UPI001CD3DBF5|nr:metallophosphoesterase [Lutimonas saemankumensis]MCA0931155.1 metallophosphoesterase [Lutimonas saemankumensis]